MESMSFNFNMEEKLSARGTNTESTASLTTESAAPPAESRGLTTPETVFSQFQAAQAQASMTSSSSSSSSMSQARGDNVLYYTRPQEPRVAATAPSASEIDMMNFRLGSEGLFDDVGSSHNYYMGSSRAESVSSQGHMWPDASAGVGPSSRQSEMVDTFDFLIKSLSSANNYVSMLTREQLFVLRSIRPSLLYEFLQEVAKLRSEKRMRRALPNECAFCKNNGENEESYSAHTLKDWRGRVTCPVLREFRCPRCGATGDHAHTIKYCPENPDTGSERAGLASRRRAAPQSLFLGGHSSHAHSGLRTPQPASAPPAPSPQPNGTPLSGSLSHSLWSTFGLN